ncbi:hypothetical protein U8326_16305 [Tsuneonella sp. CC-YZS046]|uniref:hypothetical protein n=1 Tax=Tsuneonella sp. CC-YZS046 TaxID=3042152 RepID=UPI002D7841BA|nr:hypothetical protein [Tsuneonella sp. CC-YZS046]WRO66574.1 hypothetical protein U8326_16305 [Tsuneonella sp. CC-YZS046]
MERLDAPVCLLRAREEMLLALDASNAEDESQHRKLAGDYMNAALREMRREPARQQDWDRINPAHGCAH